MITNETKIKEAVTITEVLQFVGYAPDARGKCACPVHQGKDKNFTVKGEVGTCWSQCGGKTWDAVGLVMELNKKLTYPEALEELAKIANISVEYSNNNRTGVIEAAKLEKSEKEKLYDVMNRVAAAYYEESYSGNIDKFLIDTTKTFKENTITQFELCYSGNKMFLQKNFHFDIESLMKLSLVKKKENYIYEPFRDRLLFPIHDERGRVVAFAGRKLNDDTSDYAKWINSTESLIYNKSEILYGLWQSKAHIRKANIAYIVEGYADFLTMFENSIGNVVASCGTAFTFQQAKLLKKYCDRAVLLYDGDEAGVKAAQKATAILSASGLFVDIVLLPIEHDPDSFIREHSASALLAYVEVEAKDAIIWRSLDGFKPDDMFAQQSCIDTAVSLISKIPNKPIADGYITKLHKKLGITRASLIDLVKTAQGKEIQRKHNDKTEEQITDIRDYGLFIENNRYYICNDIEHLGNEASNFIIKPLMLIIGSERSWRLVEVFNDKGKSFTADIDSDAFVDIAALKKELERRGNFIYKGKPEWFTRIKSKIYHETQECYPVQALGWHNGGFWVFGNGIVTNNEFKKINEYGIVEHNNIKYFLPAFAKVKTGSDDEDNTYEDEKEFIYVEGKIPSFQEWTRRFVDVHGANGMMGIAYFIATLYRDIIYAKFNYFPHLNLFGPPSAGKSFMAWSIGAMYGKAKTPFHLVQGTQVGFFRRLAKVRNGISWFDEYSNDVDFKRVEALKAAYDGVGHEKGSKDNEHEVKRTKVKSACIISGQQQPTQDVALFKRCISMNFPRFERDDERDARGRELKEIEQQNRLGQITAMLQKFRPLIEAEFAAGFDKVRAEVSPMVAYDKNVEDRILNNHLIPLTVFKLLESQLEFSFDYEALKAWTINNIIEQSSSISNQDELSTWWRIFNYLVESNILHHDQDFIVSEEDKITIMAKGGKGTIPKQFQEKKTILFLRFERSYSLYQEYHKKQMTKNGLSETSLKYYLKGHDNFIGEVKAKKFFANTQTKYCWAFDLEEVGLNIPLTKLFKAQEEHDSNPIKETAEAVAAMKTTVQENLPF